MEITRRYYSTKDVQTILGIGRTTANQIMHEFEQQGKMFRYGDTMRVTIEDFEEWRKQHTAAPKGA